MSEEFSYQVTTADDFKDTEIGPIPVDWDVVQLGDATQKTKSRNLMKTPEDTFLYVDVSSVSNEIFQIIGATEHASRDAPSRARKVIRSGDTIFATVRPYLRRIAQVPDSLDDQICSTAFCVIRARPNVADPDYLYHVVLSDRFVARVTKHQRGSSYPAVKDSDVLGELIPLPPLDEQRKIAHVLNTIQAEIAAQDDIIAAAQELKRSLMARLFTYGPYAEPAPTKMTEIGEIPEHWEIKRCNELCEKISVGIVVKPSSYYTPYGVPAFRSLNIREDRLALDDLVYISEEDNDTKVAKSKLRVGDVLIVRTGYPGTSCVVPEEFDGANCIDLVFARPKYSRVASEYLSRYFNSEMAKRQVAAAKIGLAQKHLNVSAVKSTLVPVPALDEQYELIEFLSAIDTKTSAEEDRKAALEALFQSMLHELMSGRVRVHEIEL